eukprot:TRINITY_DN17881_c0_g1_i1.p1 TRINITY_DN17881_c0_g1~~TRINITY_DN17881_c0_g1_i1.p1  ORF type:complete len:326 (-),score=-3.64 TRINITY_DN17881_c0_g1_i1:53-1030(-)
MSYIEDLHDLSEYLNSIPEEFHICDPICSDVPTANISFCIGASSTILGVSFILGVLLCIELVRQFRNDPRWRKLTLKNITYYFGLIYCVLRVIRYSLVLAKIPYKGPTALVFDQLLYYYAMEALIVMWSVLLIFWGYLCRTNFPSHAWFGVRMKWVFLIGNSFAFVLFTTAAITFVVVNYLWFYFTGVIALLCLGFAIGYLVEGAKVLSMVKKIVENDSTQTTLLRRLTFSTICASAVLLITFVVVIAGSFAPTDYNSCEAWQLAFRLCEFSMLGVLCGPLVGRSNERSSSSSAASPKSRESSVQSISEDISMKVVPLKSDRSYE